MCVNRSVFEINHKLHKINKIMFTLIFNESSKEVFDFLGQYV